MKLENLAYNKVLGYEHKVQKLMYLSKVVVHL